MVRPKVPGRKIKMGKGVESLCETTQSRLLRYSPSEAVIPSCTGITFQKAMTLKSLWKNHTSGAGNFYIF